jgi:hypothetical protein
MSKMNINFNTIPRPITNLISLIGICFCSYQLIGLLMEFSEAWMKFSSALLMIFVDNTDYIIPSLIEISSVFIQVFLCILMYSYYREMPIKFKPVTIQSKPKPKKTARKVFKILSI